ADTASAAFSGFALRISFLRCKEGFYFTETACSVILMRSLKYVNKRRELTLQNLGSTISKIIYATTRNYNSLYLLSLRGGFGDATCAIEVEDRDLRRHGAGGLLRRRRTGHAGDSREHMLRRTAARRSAC